MNGKPQFRTKHIPIASPMFLLLFLLCLATVHSVRTVFYTIGPFTGNLGNRSVVNALCEASATGVFTSVWAVLAYADDDVAGFPIPANDPIYTSADLLLSNGWSVNVLSYPFPVDYPTFWTGFNVNGDPDPESNCFEWSSNVPCSKGKALWTSSRVYNPSCSQSHYVLCAAIGSTITSAPSAAPTTTTPTKAPTTSIPTKTPTTSAPTKAPTGILILTGSKASIASNSGAAGIGKAVAISRDGGTIAYGGPDDIVNVGSVWMFTYSGGILTAQDAKITASASGINFGTSLALSTDGNTLAGGAVSDNGNIGTVYMYTRSGGVWTVYRTKLVGSGASGASRQGSSVSMNGAADTIAFGGQTDATSAGAVWIFIKNGAGDWVQQGSKLAPTAVANSLFGQTLSLSLDGNTLAVGAPGVNSQGGAVYVYTRSGTTWTQYSQTLVGTGFTGSTARQGWIVSLSADGQTIASGAPNNDADSGGVWIFTRNATNHWNQLGSALLRGSLGTLFGLSASLSGDGSVLAIGSPTGVGVVYIYHKVAGVYGYAYTNLIGSGNIGSSQQGWRSAISDNGVKVAVGGPADSANKGAGWAFTLP